MKTIYKYVVHPTDYQTIKLPARSSILSAQEQYDEIVLYVAVDTSDIAFEEVEILVTGTGNAINENLEEYTFLDTVKIQGGSLMLHVFYKGNIEGELP